MLSYRHGFHAGGPADLHKHAVLTALLGHLMRKQKPLTYMETHAGSALYDLTSEAARKTGEARCAIARLAAGLPVFPQPVPGLSGLMDAQGRALATLAWPANAMREPAHAAVDGDGVGPAAYAGSPALAAALCRPDDRLHLMELHPAEAPLLKRLFASDRRVSVHHRDGYEGVLAISPPRPNRGLVLIDPSYEVKTEYERVAGFVGDLRARWPQPVVMIWYPVLAAGHHVAMVDALRSHSAPNGDSEAPRIWWQEVPLPGAEDARVIKRGMQASGVIVLNAPWGFGADPAG